MLHSTHRRAALAAAVASALLVVGVASASAKTKIPKIPKSKIAVYNVEFEGSGTYSVLGTDVNGASTTVKASFSWDAKYRRLIFIRSKGTEISTVINPAKSKASGDWSIGVTNADNDNCSTSGHLGLGSSGGIEGLVQPSGKAIFKVSIGMPGFSTIGGDNGTTACSTSDFWHDWPINFSHLGNADADAGDNDPITGFSILDGSDFNHGKIVDNLSNVTPKAPDLTIHPSCGGDAGTNCTQDFGWTGHLTLTKTKL